MSQGPVMNSCEGAEQGEVVRRLVYRAPTLTFLGELSAETCSGAGTQVENISMLMLCNGGVIGMAMQKYPCA